MKIKLSLLFSVLSIIGIASVSAQTLSYSGYYVTPPVDVTVPANLLTSYGTLTIQSGNFGQEGSGPISVLTDSLGAQSDANNQWDAIGTGASLTYTLDTSTNTAGYTINAIDLISGWNDFGRADIANVTVSYELVGSSTFTTLLDGSTVIDQNYDDTMPSPGGGAFATEDVNYSNGGAALISGVQAIEFDFGAQENGYVGYQELDIEGEPTTVPEPSSLAFILLGVTAFAFRNLRHRISSALL